jgi:ankyrin repeat protein
VNLNELTDDRYAPLHGAAQLGNLAIFNALLERGAGMEIKFEYQASPIDIAAMHGHVSIVEEPNLPKE